MTLQVNKIKKTETIENDKVHEHYHYSLGGSLPTWDGDNINVNIFIGSKRRLKIEQDSLMELKQTGRQEKLVKAEKE